MQQAAELEVVFMHAILANATSASFWVLTRLHTDASLLSTARYELEQANMFESMASTVSSVSANSKHIVLRLPQLSGSACDIIPLSATVA